MKTWLKERTDKYQQWQDSHTTGRISGICMGKEGKRRYKTRKQEQPEMDSNFPSLCIPGTEQSSTTKKDMFSSPFLICVQSKWDSAVLFTTHYFLYYYPRFSCALLPIFRNIAVLILGPSSRIRLSRIHVKTQYLRYLKPHFPQNSS